MRKHNPRILSLLTAAALCASMLLPAWASAGNGVSVWSDTIGGSSAKLVSVTMQPGRTGEISLANNSVVEAASVSTLIANKNNQANTHVVAAINGGFFNSYTTGAQVFPGNCPAVMDGVVVNHKLIHTGRSATLGFTPDGKAMVDWVEFTSEVRLGNGFTLNFGGGATSGVAYGVNTYNSAPEAIMLFNEHLTLPVAIPASSTMVLIQNGVVTSIESGYTLTVPKGMDVLVYNSAAAQFYQSLGQFPQVGMSARVVLSAKGTYRDGAWSNVESALTGGPVLVKDGANVVDDQRNASFYSDSKQKPDAVLARSFVGITSSGSLVMGTVTASFRQIANWMVSNGIQEGIAMDGGGSCMLYAEGSGYLSSGRALATALTIVDRTGAGGLPAESNVGSISSDTPSGWAAADIQTAISLGLVPNGTDPMQPVTLQRDYQENITRQDFCLLIWELVKKQPGYLDKLYSQPEVSFSDVNGQTGHGEHLLWVARLNIINGNTNGTFSPYNTLTREQAAKILANTAKFLGAPENTRPASYTDSGKISSWAREFVDYCSANDILKGNDDGTFNPQGHLTRQQAIITVLRLYNQYSAT